MAGPDIGTCRSVAFFSCSETVGDEPVVLVALVLGFLDGHIVDHSLYAVNVAHKLAGQVLFSRVPGFAPQLDHTFFRLDSGVVEDTGRLMVQQRRLDQCGDGRVINRSDHGIHLFAHRFFAWLH